MLAHQQQQQQQPPPHHHNNLHHHTQFASVPHTPQPQPHLHQQQHHQLPQQQQLPHLHLLKQQQQHHQQLHQPSSFSDSCNRHPLSTTSATTSSSAAFAPYPLTPISSSQSHSQRVAYPSATPPLSSATDSPIFSLETFAGSSSCGGDNVDGDGTEFSSVPLFQAEELSMQQADAAYDQLHPAPPIKLYSSWLGDGNDGLVENQDADAGGVSLLLQNGLAHEGNVEYNSDLLSPANCAQSSHSQPQHHRRKSSASSAPVPSLDSSASSFASSPAGGGLQRRQFPSTPSLNRPLPTPEHTPVQQSFVESSFDSWERCAGNADASKEEMAMRQAIPEQQQQGQQSQQSQQHQHQQPQASADDDTLFPYSLPSSAPSLNSSNPTATPQPNLPGDFDGASRAGVPHGEDRARTADSTIDWWMDECLQFDGLNNTDYGSNNSHIPFTRVDRSITDMVQDELYNPTMSAIPQSHPGPMHHKAGDGPGSSNPFPSYRNPINDRLQAAHQGHMAAAQVQGNGERRSSPFRQGSPYAPPASAYHSAHLQQPSQLTSEMPQPALRGMDLGQGEPKTISPKEALIEYHEPSEESSAPLFPPHPDSAQYQAAMGRQHQQQQPQPQPQPPHQLPHPGQHHQQQPLQPQSRMPAGQQFMGMDHYHNQYGRAPQAQPHYYLQQQALQQELQRQQQQQHGQQPTQKAPANRPGQLPFDTSNGRILQQTPEFPQPIPSMGSTLPSTSAADDGLSTPTTKPMKELTSSPVELARRPPEGTSSDAGTYSCTYHGCTLRFETPARLQKHKREAHRQSSPGSHGIVREAPTSLGAASAPAGAGTDPANSQAGPHRCDRINPTTGKPCNSIFSRPYDLTRHEDTIHNARKRKVRCHLCTEEKTFSRNDALTRHMRVVHPEVNWPGKQKRKGRD